MRTLTEQLTGYAACHRDHRNIATHLFGIPMIVVSITILLSRPSWNVGPVSISPAVIAVVATVLYYLKLDVRYGLVMAALLALSLFASQRLAALQTSQWLAWGLGLFFVGWVIQFIGHIFEGKKPAFVDDLMGLIIGPLFVVAEVGFWLGLRKSLQAKIEEQFAQEPTITD